MKDTRELQAKLAKNQEYMIKLSEELTEVKQELIEVTGQYYHYYYYESHIK